MQTGTFDFFALNQYTTRLATPCEYSDSNHPAESILRDAKVEFEADPNWPTSAIPAMRVRAVLIRIIFCVCIHDYEITKSRFIIE